MPSFLKLSGVRLGGSGPQIDTGTAEAAALGGVPGFNVWWEAEYSDATAETVLNRAQANRAIPAVDGFFPDTVTMGSGAAFDATDLAPLVLAPNRPIRPDEWTFLVVVKPITDTSRQIFVKPTTDVGATAMQIGLISTGHTVYVYETGTGGSGQPVRLEYRGDFEQRAGASLIMVTFSTRDGLKIWDGGTLAASDAADTAPLTLGYGAGEWDMMRFVRGQIGMSAIFDVDLGKAENALHRAALTDWLVAKYDVTLPS